MRIALRAIGAVLALAMGMMLVLPALPFFWAAAKAWPCRKPTKKPKPDAMPVPAMTQAVVTVTSPRIAGFFHGNTWQQRPL